MNIKNTLTYAFLIGLSVWLTIFINGEGGVMLCVCLGTALVISIADFLAVRKRINFDIRYDNINLRKGDNFGMTLVVSKNTCLPTPYVEIKLKSSEKLRPMQPEIIKTAMFINKKPLQASIVYKAEFSGNAVVEIEYVRLTDYLGIISKNIYINSENANKAAKLRIIPEIPDSVTLSDLLKSSCEAAAYDDNDEDTGEIARFGSGTPGYEHRPYVPGDPVKKINWKLSSKKDSYLLRLDEKIAVTSRIVILDIVTKNPSREQYRTNDILIEGSLGFLSEMLRRELECDFYIYTGNDWECIKISDEKSMEELQSALSGYNDTKEHKNRIPPELNDKGSSSVAIIFTNNPCELHRESENLPNVHCLSVTTAESMKQKTENTWIIDELYEIKRA